MKYTMLSNSVLYRGSLGLHAVRAAIVVADTHSLEPAGVEAGVVPPLDSPEHVHLWVYTVGKADGWFEPNVPFIGIVDGADQAHPNTAFYIRYGHWPLVNTCPCPEHVAQRQQEEVTT
jgi:hypothetical protein